MKKSKLKTIIPLLIVMILCLSVGAYAGYSLSAKDVTYTKSDGTTVTVKEALDELRAKQLESPSIPSIETAVSDDMLTKTTNTTVKDAYGNRITIPAGFKIKVDDTTNNAKTVDKGIVIVDSNENEFVWIPTGKIYTDTAMTEEKAKTIELNRYTFDSSGNPTAKGDAAISSYQELATSSYENTTAKDISSFKKIVEIRGGFYIGRYEARKNSSGTITEKGTDSVWNSITQPNAATQARNMYQNATTYTSDLVNSYAWDTATLFLQTFGTNSNYSNKNSLNTSLATTGTNNQTTKDVQCNVYDMASNIREWTTETYSNSNSPCVPRGGNYDYSYDRASYRYTVSTSGSYRSIGFRPLLYL